MGRAPRLPPSMPSSTLGLTINKGPKAGETLACNPGTVIRIGRVARGNTLAIKDPGISQKHFTVGFLPEFNRWVVTDLGSSNGTHINGSLISPEQPSALSDGDVIKIGENTSIYVNISPPVHQTLVVPRCDRPPRPPKVKHEDKELAEDEASKMGHRARGRGRKRGRSTRFSTKDEVSESVLVEPRVTRSSARGGSIRVFVNKSKEEDVSIISNSEFVDVMEKEKQSKENNARVEEEVVAVDGENNNRVEELKNNMDSTSKENNAGAEEELLTLDGEINSRVEKLEDNWNNMTLEEWFDRMEEYLPKSIHMVAEELIDKLSEKAQFFDEYISQISNVPVE
ncbi:FHA domain-containing protein At4g14490-like [Phalaenopsis equestris]|uniref:FHA domain-containing protein At4g14490-like n=1 Tax=Phalaenopsis equestris TaxID=78828 RepID=UPI0009E25EB7|nr:FHA domain-containing protein At4g14490-like [Phalaenopsis equestris]XP_020595254.1 FHA domain-containing protein At4g14490-like [Phalaenopsis equestris]